MNYNYYNDYPEPDDDTELTLEDLEDLEDEKALAEYERYNLALESDDREPPHGWEGERL